MHFQRRLSVQTSRQGLLEITRQIEAVVTDSGASTGLCTLFLRHTSAGLLVQENADPDVREDLHRFLDRLVPEGDPLYRHTAEGPDDMPAHVKSALMQTTLGIPIFERRLTLGTWQGIYLWEHRARGHRREIVVHITGDS